MYIPLLRTRMASEAETFVGFLLLVECYATWTDREGYKISILVIVGL